MTLFSKRTRKTKQPPRQQTINSIPTEFPSIERSPALIDNIPPISHLHDQVDGSGNQNAGGESLIYLFFYLYYI